MSKYDEPCPACGVLAHPTDIAAHLPDCWPRQVSKLRERCARLEHERDEWADRCAEQARDAVMHDKRARKAEGRLALLDPGGRYVAELNKARARCTSLEAVLRRIAVMNAPSPHADDPVRVARAALLTKGENDDADV